MFKRNFTMGLSQPLSPADGAAWGPSAGGSAMTSYTFTGGSPGGTSTDATQIACAINIFGQNNIYQLTSGYNGYCLNPLNAPNNAGGEFTLLPATFHIPSSSEYCAVLTSMSPCVIVYGAQPSFSRCLISFTNPTTNTKRDTVIGSFNGWDIESEFPPLALAILVFQGCIC
jgi:hypothetical protein